MPHVSEQSKRTRYIDLGHIKHELSSLDDANVYIRVFRESIRRQKVLEMC